jgi:flagellar basal-body rod protein FlgC
MDYLASFAISAAGMSLERTRVDAAAINLANANTVQGADGSTYRPVRVVAQAAAANSAFGTVVDQGLMTQMLLRALPEVSIEAANVAPRTVYEPGHPLADTKGFVRYANVDPATEMVTMMSATRAYEANLAAMNTARTLAMRALEIGGGA